VIENGTTKKKEEAHVIVRRNNMHIGVIASMKKGLEHFVYRELLVFASRGYSISLFPTKYQSGLYNAREEWALHRWNPLAIALLQPYFFLRAPIRYLRLLREALTTGAFVDFALAWCFSQDMADVDIIYATFGDHKLFVGYFCKQIVHKPLAVTIHAYELYQNPNPRLFLRALSACDQIITVTEYNRELLTTRYRIDPSKIEVVRISVDVEDYRPAKKFIVLIVAFFAERKGHEVLFKAIKQLAQEDIEVWVVGDEGVEEAVNVRRLAVQLGVDSHVAFFGKLSGNALKALYHACDVFCLPCRRDSKGIAEGFPTVLAEAMAFSKPVITTRHVEIPRIIDEILIDENDVQGLVHAIRQVYQSAALRQRLGEKNREIAEKYFSSRNAERTAKILHGLARQYQESRLPQYKAVPRSDSDGKTVEVMPR
jgi:colanic acid/amylovoran biosynthesis glycosyltransferase